MVKIILTATLCFILGFIARDFEVPRFFQIRPVSKVDQVRAIIRSVAVTIATEATSGGSVRYPQSLNDFHHKALQRELQPYRDPISDYHYDWLYFGRNVDLTQNTNTLILLATPTRFNKEGEYPKLGDDQYRIIAYMDGHVEMVLEADFQQRIETQLSH